MHIPDGFLDPVTLTVAGAASVGALAWSVRELRRGDVRWGLAAGGAGTVLLAHLADVPLYGPYTAHVIGGTLLAVALGPWLAMLTMAAVLALEALAWGDGGIAALGVNMLVMGVAGVLVGWGVYRGVLVLVARTRDPGVIPGVASWWRVPAAAAGAWCSVIASASTLAAVSVVGGSSGLVLDEVVMPHVAWGLLEAAATALLVAAGVLVVGLVRARRERGSAPRAVGVAVEPADGSVGSRP